MYHNIRDKNGRFTKRGVVNVMKNAVMPKKRAKKTTKKVAGAIFDCVVLDESGSMHSRTKTTVDGFNEYVTGLQKIDKLLGTDTKCTLIRFGNPHNFSIITSYDGVSAVNVGKLTDYNPSSGTPLNDSVATALTLMHTKWLICKGKCDVTITIMTDGEENTSVKFPGVNNPELVALITEMRDNCKFTINYIGMGSKKAIEATAAGMGIYAGNTVSYAGTGASVTATFNTLTQSRSAHTKLYASTGVNSNEGFFSED